MANRHVYSEAKPINCTFASEVGGPPSGFARVSTWLLRGSSGALRALSHLLSAARVVCWPCLVALELKLAFAVRIDCLGASPMLLLLLLLHQGHRDRATAMQADEEAAHVHYSPPSDVCAPILHRSN